MGLFSWRGLQQGERSIRRASEVDMGGFPDSSLQTSLLGFLTSQSLLEVESKRDPEVPKSKLTHSKLRRSFHGSVYAY